MASLLVSMDKVNPKRDVGDDDDDDDNVDAKVSGVSQTVNDGMVYASGAEPGKNPLEQFSERIAQFGRIAAMPAVQSGMMDGSIPSDEATAELLNMGPIPKAELDVFESAKAAGLPNRLKALPADAIDGSQRIVALENKIISLSLIISKNGENKIQKTFSLNSDFVNKMTELSQSQEIAAVANIPKHYAKIVSLCVSIENRTDKKGKVITGLLDDLLEEVKSLMALEQSLPDLEKKFGDLSWMAEGAASIAPLVDFLDQTDIRMEFPELARLQGVENTSLAKNFKVLADLSTTFDETRAGWQSILIVINSRSSPLKMGREWTNGLTNGFADVSLGVNDLRDPAIKELIPGDATAFMEEGLKPIVKHAEGLLPLDEKLKALSTSAMKGVAERMVKLVEKDGEVSEADVVKLHEAFSNCEKEYKDVLDAQDTKELKKLVVAINATPGQFGSFLASVKTHIASKPLTTADMNKLIEVLSKVPSDGNTSANEMQKKAIEVRQELMSGGMLTKVKEASQKCADSSTGLSGKEVVEAANTVVQGGAKIKSFMSQNNVGEELTFYKCLDEQKEVAGKVAAKLEKTQALRGLQPSDLDDASKAVSVVSDTVKAIKALPTQKNMKANSGDKTDEVNKMKDGLKTSATIGGVSRAVVSAQLLKKQHSDGAGREQLLKTVKAVLAKNPNKQNRRVTQFPIELQKLFASVQVELQKIDAFEKDLDVPKMKSAKDFAEKLKIFNLDDVKPNNIDDILDSMTLIQLSTDPPEKEELEKGQKALAHLNTLDLNFAQHRSDLSDSPAAFQSLADYFESFSSAVAKKPKAIVVVDENGFPISIVIPIVVGVAVSAGLVTGGVCYWRRKKKGEKIEEPEQPDYEQRSLEEMAAKIFSELGANNSPQTKKLVLREIEIIFHIMQGDDLRHSTFRTGVAEISRYINVLLAKKHVVYVTKADGSVVHIHANEIHGLVNGRPHDIATQGPMDANGNKRSTVGDFLDMAMNKRAQFIVMLCNLQEDGREKCAQYYPLTVGETLSKDEHTVRALEINTICNGDIIVRKLRITNNTNNTTHTLTQYHYTAWRDHGVPTNEESFNALFDAVHDNTAPVIVHCSAGVGRTMTFIGTRIFYDAIRLEVPKKFHKIYGDIREQRAMAIQTVEQLVFIQEMAAKTVIRKLHVPIANQTTPAKRAKVQAEAAKLEPDFRVEFPDLLTQISTVKYWTETNPIEIRRNAGVDQRRRWWQFWLR